MPRTVDPFVVSLSCTKSEVSQARKQMPSPVVWYVFVGPRSETVRPTVYVAWHFDCSTDSRPGFDCLAGRHSSARDNSRQTQIYRFGFGSVFSLGKRFWDGDQRACSFLDDAGLRVMIMVPCDRLLTPLGPVCIPLQTRQCLMNTAKRSEASTGSRWGSFGKHGWMTDAYALRKMIADHKGWFIDHLFGLQIMPEDLNERGMSEFANACSES